ncbi:cytoplasmic protein [Bacillus pseudomycoides]|uniref:cytoplasmic protein n=1 Tax=Bacillus pseudomycoides TaxID=64104 RepID=UPI0012B6A30C|nr:cytoplasmic protein [Bacillus pseudomycoides]
MDGIKDLVQVSIHTNERDIEFTSFNGHVQIKQSLDGETTSVVVTNDELDMLQSVSNENNLSRFMSSILSIKAL